MALLLMVVAACARSDGSSAAPAESDPLANDTIPASFIGPTDMSGDMEAVIELATDSLRAPVHPQPRFVTLPPVADSLAKYMVFAARGQSWYTAAVRGKRMLVDMGRFDARLPSRKHIAAFREAIDSIAPVRTGDRFRLYGPWGSDTVTVSGFDLSAGRIVATLNVPPRVDSLARRHSTLIAGALRTDSVSVGVTGTCSRESASEEVWLRAGFARDSVEQALREASLWLPERLQHTLRVQTSHAIGCFADARMIVVVTLLGGNFEYVRQGAVAISDSAGVTPLAVLDPRFRAHVALHALDADGDGVDDIAMRGRAERVGAMVVLRYNVEEKRLERLATGFAWERN
ncbi:MAG: hypothetical protein ACT4PJ_17955 [Gemmatimonadaceae bacterium]